jgi:hypothetical protein
MTSPPKLEGTLATRSFTRLIINALNRGFGGSLELRADGQVVATLVFLRGLPVKARTATPFHLVPLLAEMGILHQSELPRILPPLLAGGELHGRALVRKGFLSPEEVELGLREQLGRQLVWMSELGPATAYRLLPDLDSLAGYGGDLVTPFDPLPFVWASIRAHTPPTHARARIEKLGMATFHMSEEADPTRFRFDEAAMSVVAVLQRWSCRADEIAVHASVTEGFALLVLHTLLLTRQVVVVPPASVAVPPPERIDSQPEILSIESVPALPRVLQPPPSERPASSKPPSNGGRKRVSARIPAVVAPVAKPSVKPIPRTDDDAPSAAADVVHMRPQRAATGRRKSIKMRSVTPPRPRKG